jgi:2,4-dienoyl-CoA reductase-like NADH-dependent reductase (Old Yellow Enzyme family)
MEHISPFFEPFTVGPLTLRNRFVMAPMTRSFSPGNVPSEKVVAYYERRALNQVGLIISEGTCVGHPGSSGYDNVPYFYGDESLAGWQQVIDAVHAAGGKMMPQLWHVGAIRNPDKDKTSDAPAFSPSGLIKPGKQRGAAMTKQDIDDVIDAFASGAADAKQLGFDGVEIHGAHGYLLDQFFWEGTNRRDDKYGGDLVKRTRFVAELIAAVRDRVGVDFPICLRWSQWKQQDYNAKLANTPSELEDFLKPLCDAGVDIFHCSTRRFWEPEFDDSTLNLAGWTKKLTGKATITVGSVGLNGQFIDEEKRDMVDQSDADSTKLEELQRGLAAGEFDLVAVGRALLQDPEWVLKVQAGRLDELQSYTKASLMSLV